MAELESVIEKNLLNSFVVVIHSGLTARISEMRISYGQTLSSSSNRTIRHGLTIRL